MVPGRAPRHLLDLRGLPARPIAGANAWGAGVMSQNKAPGQVESKARRLMHDLKKEEGENP